MYNEKLNIIKELLTSDVFSNKNITIEDIYIYEDLDALFISSNEEDERLLFIDSEDGYIEAVIFKNNKLKERVDGFDIEDEDLNNHEKITSLINKYVFEHYFKNNDNELSLS